jgi:hypothetical protein
LRISRTNGIISLRDRPAPSWLLGLFLLGGGLVAIAMPLGLASNTGELQPWERLVSLGIGLGVSAGALWWLARSPGTHARLDLARRRLRVARTGLFGRRVQQFSFDDLASVQVEQGSDSEGGMVWRPVVMLHGNGALPLSELWSHDRAGVEDAVASVSRACGIPQVPPSKVPAPRIA